MKDLSIVIPAHKEDPKSIYKLYQYLTLEGAEVIVVDDGDTMELDDIPHFHYRPNMGYGYAIKYGIDRATRPIILTMDSDLQHLPEDAIKLYKVFNLIEDCAMVIGTRWNLKESPHRWIGRKILNFTASCLALHYMQDMNSGMRIFKRDLAIGYKDILCDTFSFTTSLAMSIVGDGHKVAWFPIDVQPRKFGKSHVRVIKDGLITLWYILWIGCAVRTRHIRECFRGLFKHA